MDLNQIPGYTAAVEREREIRDGAFLDLPELICGVDALPLTPVLLTILEGAKNPLVCGVQPLPEDVAQFLWAVSPERTGPFQSWKRGRFIRRIRSLKYDAAVEAIHQYLADAFQDAPGGSRGPSSPEFANLLSAVVDVLASEYHWHERDILAMPFKRIFQYVRRIEKRHNRDAIFFNPSDKVRGDWLDQINARNQ